MATAALTLVCTRDDIPELRVQGLSAQRMAERSPGVRVAQFTLRPLKFMHSRVCVQTCTYSIPSMLERTNLGVCEFVDWFRVHLYVRVYVYVHVRTLLVNRFH